MVRNLKDTITAPVDNESGRASLLSIASFLVLIWYFKEGHSLLLNFLKEGTEVSLGSTKLLFNSDLYPVLNMSVIACLCIVILFSTGCWIHLVISGARTPKTGQMRRRLKKLAKLVDTSRDLIQEYQSTMFKHHTMMSGRSQNCLSVARCVVSALEYRIREIDQLMRSRSRANLYRAAELMESNLDLRGNCVDNIVYDPEDYQQLPEIKATDCRPVLEELFNTIYEELRAALERHEMIMKKSGSRAASSAVHNTADTDSNGSSSSNPVHQELEKAQEKTDSKKVVAV